MGADTTPPAGAAAAGPIVRIEGLRKSFGANEVLKGIDLTVQPGEVLAIIGKSGSARARCCAASTGWRPSSTARCKWTARPSSMAMPRPCGRCASMWA